MNLSAPTMIVFIISLVLALVGLFGSFAIIPVSGFWLMTVAYIVLAAGCLLKGI